MAFYEPKQLETPVNKGSFRITSAMETVSSRYGNCQFPARNCQFPPWELVGTKLNQRVKKGRRGGKTV
jgi:hypothetical protein